MYMLIMKISYMLYPLYSPITQHQTQDPLTNAPFPASSNVMHIRSQGIQAGVGVGAGSICQANSGCV